jgi:hypothetical protein
MTITYEDMVRAEKQALILLQWRLLKPTVYSFLESLIGFGIIYSNEQSATVDEVRMLKI